LAGQILKGAATMVSAANVNNRLPKLVNDLDVRVSDGSTTAHPWTLDPNQPNQSASTGDNIRDNVEQIFITNPIPGQTYTITVTHKGQLKYSAQPFSLIVSGLFRKIMSISGKSATWQRHVNMRRCYNQFMD